LKEEKISSFQAVMLFAALFLGSIIVLNPAASAGEDGWFSSLVGTFAGFLVFSIIAALAIIHPGKSLIGILIFCFGSRAGKIIGFIYVLYFVRLAGEISRNFCYYSNSVDLSETPILFILICYMLLVVFIVKIGLEVIGRLSEVLILVMVLIIAITLLSFFTDFHPDAFLPMFKSGVVKPAVSGLNSAILPFGEGIVALTILPNLNDRKKTFKVTSLSVLVAGAIMFVVMTRDIMTLGVSVAARNVFPSEKVYRLMLGIDVYPLLEISVIITGVLKVSLVVYATAKSLAEIFSLKDFKIFVAPIAIYDMANAMSLHYSLFTQLYWPENIVPLLDMPILLIMPIIMLAISLIKKDSQKGPVQQLE
jgi:spore germination protein KB